MDFLPEVIMLAIVCAALVWEFRDDFPIDKNHTGDLVFRFLFIAVASIGASLADDFTAKSVIVRFISASLIFWIAHDELQNARLQRPVGDARPGGSRVDTWIAGIKVNRLLVQFLILGAWAAVLIVSSVNESLLHTLPLSVASTVLPITSTLRSVRKRIAYHWIPVFSAQAILCFFVGWTIVGLRPDGIPEPEYFDVYSWGAIGAAALFFIPLAAILWKK